MNEVTISELEAQHVELLPARETLNHRGSTTFNWASVVANNSSLALNAGSLFAHASSNALQYISVSQH